MMPPAGHFLWQWHLKGQVTATFHYRLRTSQRLHTPFGRNPLATSHVTVAAIDLETEAESPGLLGGEQQLVPPLRRKHLERPFTIAMHLVVKDDPTYSLLFEGLKVGSDALMGSNGLTMKPPYLRTRYVLRMVETVGERCLCDAGDKNGPEQKECDGLSHE